MGELIDADRQLALRHLSNSTFVELRPSARHGVGVFATRRIPAGVDAFNTNGPPSGATLDLTAAEVEKLPAHVQATIRHFVVPHREQDGGSLLYGMPNAGLNTLDASWYLNNDVEAPNVQFGDEHDQRGFTRILSTRDIEVDEELVLPYDLANTGRTRGGIKIENEEKGKQVRAH